MHPFLILREKLSPLQFQPAIDASAEQPEAFNKYLKFYQLEFPEKICRQHAAGTFEAGGYTISAQYWLPNVAQPKGTIFVLHGYYDHVGLLSHVLQFVLEMGYIAVAYDQPGHGLSSGERASIGSFSEYVDVLHGCMVRCEHNFPKPWHGLGQSTGGAVLLRALMVEKITDTFTSMILLAPLVKPAGWDAGRWSYQLLKRFIKKIPRRFSNNSNDETFVRFCQREDPLQSRYLSLQWVGAMKEWLDAFRSLPTATTHGLVIQGEADRTVDWCYNLAAIKAKVQGMEYYQLAGARHQLVNERDDLRVQIFARIQEFLLASSPS